MKTLHVYSHSNPRLAMYVSLLSQAMPADVECVYSDNASDVRLAANDFRPDIVHQHGRLPAALQAAVVRALQADDGRPPARLVVSLHGEQPDTAMAYATIARSPYELAACTAERKEMIQNPLITKTITFQEAAAAVAAVYARVLNSDPLELMDEATRHFLAVTLKAGLLGDRRWVSADTDEPPAEASQPDFRLMYIYAELEGVLDTVLRGLEVLGIDAPERKPYDCYLPHAYSTPEAMPGASITELLRDIEQNGATLLRLTELMRALYDDSLDEKALMEQADAEKLRPLMQSAVQVLSERTLLTEGFMPCRPVDSGDTQRMRMQLERHLRPITTNQ